MSTIKRGLSVEYKFISYCLENNISVSKPISDDVPYDCIIDINGKLLKIQIKRAYQPNKGNENFIFNTRTINPKGSGYNITTYDSNSIDYFIVWFEKFPDIFFIFDVNDISKSGKTLYYGDIKKKTKRQHYYKDYILDFNNLK